jgi:hypothetical protein
VNFPRRQLRIKGGKQLANCELNRAETSFKLNGIFVDHWERLLRALDN